MAEDYFCIGDIHGRLDLIKDLLTKFGDSPYYKTHRLVMMGDYIDRGPNGYEVLELVKHLTETHDAIALLGNHEEFMLRYATAGVPDKTNVWFYGGNGGMKTVLSYNNHFEEYGFGHFFNSLAKSGHRRWLESLPLYYETEKVWFSHAPIGVWVNLEPTWKTNRERMLWTYFGNTDKSAYDHGKLALCGHVHALQEYYDTADEKFLEPRIFPKIIFSDTGSGCAPDGRLSGVIITDGKYEGFIQAKPNE